MRHSMQKAIMALFIFMLPTGASFGSEDLTKTDSFTLYYKKGTPDQQVIKFTDGVGELSTCGFVQKNLIFTNDLSCFLKPHDEHRIALLLARPSVISELLPYMIEQNLSEENIVCMWRHCYHGESPLRQIDIAILSPSESTDKNLYQIWRRIQTRWLLSSYVFTCGMADFMCEFKA